MILGKVFPWDWRERARGCALPLREQAGQSSESTALWTLSRSPPVPPSQRSPRCRWSPPTLCGHTTLKGEHRMLPLPSKTHRWAIAGSIPHVADH